MGTTHRLSPRDVAVLARAWRGGVGAGQLLLTTAAAAAENAAGAGTVALPTRHGRVEIRARLDGTPGLAGSQVSVDPSRTVPRSVTGDDEEGSHAGGLRIGGNVSRVGCIRATGDMVVEQMVDQAELHAGRSLIVEGRATASELHAGSATGALQRIHRTAHDVADRLALVVDEYAQVAAAATEAAAAPRPADLVRALTERRHPELAGMVDEVSGVLSDARRGWPELLAELGDVIRDVARLLDPGRAPSEEDPLDILERCVNATRAGVPSRRPGGGDLRVDYADRCTLTAHGSLRIAGRGARASTIDVSEDLFAVAPGSTIQSCTVRVGGVMRAVELASTEDAALRIEFPEPRPLPDLLRADVVHPGVQVIVGGQLLSFDRRQDNVQVGIEAGQITRTSH